MRNIKHKALSTVNSFSINEQQCFKFENKHLFSVLVRTVIKSLNIHIKVYNIINTIKYGDKTILSNFYRLNASFIFYGL
jgi:hypothetical protein